MVARRRTALVTLAFLSFGITLQALAQDPPTDAPTDAPTGEQGEQGEAPEEPRTDPRPTREILTEILEKRDAVDLELFDVIGRRLDLDALNALKVAAPTMFSPSGMEAAFEAFRFFAGSPLEPEALEFLARESNQGYPYKQRAAIRVLMAYGDVARPALRTVFHENTDTVCRQIAIGGLLTELRTLGTKEALANLLNWYRPPVSGSFELGVRTLSAFKGREALQLMEKTLRDKRVPGDVHAMVVEALAKIPGEHVDELLIDVLRSKQPEVELAAIQALQLRGVTRHWRELERLERSREPAVRRAAFIAQAAIRPANDVWLKKVQSAARSRDFALRMGACVALASLQEVPQVHELLADANALVRREAIEACATLRRKISIPALIERMDPETLRLRRDIQEALIVITGQDHGRTSARWKTWWAGEGARFSVPPLEEVQKLIAAREKRRAEGATQADFYGIRLDSDRVCFVLDTSGSMAYPVGPAAAVGIFGTGGASRLEAVQEELVATLQGIPDGAQFNLVFFSTRPERWKKKLVEMDDDTRKAGVRHVRQQKANGATALYDALLKAFDDENVDTIFLLSDGEPTEGKIVDPLEILREIRTINRLRQVRIHCIAVDYTAGLLESLAEETGGDYIEVK